MKNFELKYKSGPGGDQCTTYDIVFHKDNVTVWEFISFIVSINAEEYGEFYVYYTDPKLKAESSAPLSLQEWQASLRR